jgi:hypothetical protein
MEFFASANAHMTPTDLQRFIRIRNMPEWCTSIEKVSTQSGERGIMSWTKGEDAVHQEIIRNGIHFTLPGSEDVMQWSITAEPGSQNGRVTIHCTVNRTELDLVYQQCLLQFVDDWKAGLENGWARIKAELGKKPKLECAPWYG